MKKIISTILLLCLVFSGCILLASCDKVKKNDLTKNPTETLSDTLSNTWAEFFKDGIGLYDVIDASSKKSSVEAYFESELLGEDISRISATVYSDPVNNKYVLEAGAKYKGSDLTGTIFADKKGITAKSQSIFGTSDAYGFYFDSFIAKFKNSYLAELMSLDDETAQQVIDAVKKAQETLNNSAVENRDNAFDLGDDLFKIFGQTVTTEKVKVNNKNVDLLVLTYKIDNKSIELALDKIYNEYIKEQDPNGDVKTSLDSTIQDMNENAAINVTVKANIIQKSNTLSNITVKGTISQIYTNTDTAYNSQTIVLDAAINFSDTAITIKGSASDGNERYTFEANITKNVTKEAVTYNVTAKAGTKSVSINLIDGSIVFNKKSGSFAISANVFKDESSTYAFNMNGTYSISKKKSASFRITSVKLDGETVEFTLGITLNAKPNIPATPKNAKDLIDFKQNDWEKFVESMSNSDLVKMVNDLNGSDDSYVEDPVYNYDYDYDYEYNYSDSNLDGMETAVFVPSTENFGGFVIVEDAS